VNKPKPQIKQKKEVIKEEAGPAEEAAEEEEVN